MSELTYDATIEHAGGLTSEIRRLDEVPDEFYVGLAEAPRNAYEAQLEAGWLLPWPTS